LPLSVRLGRVLGVAIVAGLIGFVSEATTLLAPLYSWRLIGRSDGRFVNEYVNTLVVALLANELEVRSGTDSGVSSSARHCLGRDAVNQDPGCW
jgi:hypothetical protein